MQLVFASAARASLSGKVFVACVVIVEYHFFLNYKCKKAILIIQDGAAVYRAY
jgi:hypothetical protein